MQEVLFGYKHRVFIAKLSRLDPFSVIRSSVCHDLRQNRHRERISFVFKTRCFDKSILCKQPVNKAYKFVVVFESVFLSCLHTQLFCRIYEFGMKCTFEKFMNC